MNITDIRKIPLMQKKYRTISIWMICIAVFILIYIVQISGTLATLKKSQENEEALKQEFQAAVTKQEKLETSLASFKTISKDYAAWQAKIMPDSNILDEINEVLKIAGKNNLIFNRFDPGDEIATGKYIRVPIDVNIAGNFHDFATFLSNVANLPSIVVISDFTINKNQETSAPRNLIIDLHLELFFKSEAKANDNQAAT